MVLQAVPVCPKCPIMSRREVLDLLESLVPHRGAADVVQSERAIGVVIVADP